MEFPIGGFVPAFVGEDVVLTISVYVTGADPVTGSGLADDMFNELAIFGFVPGDRVAGTPELRENVLGFSAVAQIHQNGKLHVAARLDYVFLPGATLLAGIFIPPQLFRMPGAADDVRIAVAIYVDGKVAEIFDVVIDVFERAELMFDPFGTLIPVLAGDDIGVAITIEINDGAGFIGPQIDDALFEWDIVWPGSRPGGGDCKSDKPFHAPDFITNPAGDQVMINSVNTLVIDVGGTHVKLLATGMSDSSKIPSGPAMTPKQMVKDVQKATKGWKYDRISMGYPGLVVRGKPITEPHNLGKGWVGFDYAKALGKPVRIINDAAMQALGSYRSGTMLFLGVGTGLGSALIADGVLEPLELAHLPFKNGRTYEEYVGKAGLERMGKKRWKKIVLDVIVRLKTALEADYVELGGGNAALVDPLPEGVRLGDNANAFKGGFLLWEEPKKAKVRLSLGK
jgi:polyphosphate glucokinase